MDMFALEQRLATLETRLVEAQKDRQKSEAQLSRQDRLVDNLSGVDILCGVEGVEGAGVMQER